MTRGRAIKINENFFDDRPKTIEERKIMLYVLGASFAIYSHRINNGKYHINQWQSSSKDLMEIVNTSLERDGKIYGPTQYKNIREEGSDFEIYFIRVQNEKIYNDLVQWGFGVPKSERRFPKNIGYTDFIHLLRGFLDAQASCCNSTRTLKDKDNEQYNYQSLNIYYDSVPFLNELYATLVKYDIVKGGRNITKYHLGLYGEDVSAVAHFIYNMDWVFTEKHGLYLDSKKELFEQASRNNLSKRANAIEASQRIDDTITLLLEGKIPHQFAEQPGYAHSTGLYRAFKKQTGQTIGEFVNSDEFLMPRKIYLMRSST